MLFALRLALALGKTLAQLQRDVSPQEFALWKAYYQHEPFGSLREDSRALAIVSQMHNAHFAKRESDLIEIEPFFRRWRPRPSAIFTELKNSLRQRKEARSLRG